jgi:hypothetical protein
MPANGKIPAKRISPRHNCIKKQPFGAPYIARGAKPNPDSGKEKTSLSNPETAIVINSCDQKQRSALRRFFAGE